MRETAARGRYRPRGTPSEMWERCPVNAKTVQRQKRWRDTTTGNSGEQRVCKACCVHVIHEHRNPGCEQTSQRRPVTDAERRARSLRAASGSCFGRGGARSRPADARGFSAKACDISRRTHGRAVASPGGFVHVVGARLAVLGFAVGDLAGVVAGMEMLACARVTESDIGCISKTAGVGHEAYTHLTAAIKVANTG